jgi:indolepyruvate ferredoxin oxidoreductase beta subunit
VWVELVSQINEIIKKNTIAKKTFNLLNIGVGGQGVIRTIEILAWAALLDDYEVRTAETHGMAQRGGSVAAHLRFGKGIMSPLIPRGKVDIILAFEMSEALRICNYAGPNTYFFINDKIEFPPMVHQVNKNYQSKEKIRQFLEERYQNVFFIKAHELALKAGNYRTSNIVMLGVLSGSGTLPISQESLEFSILKFIPINTQEVNNIAFQLGIEKGVSIRREIS